jgi:hypothetical protein
MTGIRSKEAQGNVQRSVGVDIDRLIQARKIKVSERRVSCRVMSVVKSRVVNRPAVHPFPNQSSAAFHPRPSSAGAISRSQH